MLRNRSRGWMVAALWIVACALALAVLPGVGGAGAAVPASAAGPRLASAEHVSLVASRDTWLDRDEIDEPKCGTQLRVGYRNALRGLLGFDLGALPPGIAIDSARLRAYATGWSGRDTILGAHVVLRPWTECEATWHVARAGVPWGKAGCDDTATDRRATPESTVATHGIRRWYEWDLTVAAQGWLAGTLPNHGVLLMSTTYDLEVFFFGSRSGDPAYRPTLEVDYHFTGPPTDTPTATASPTVTSTPTQSATPTASATATATRTASPTATATSTATQTPTRTATPTVTATRTATPIPPLRFVKLSRPADPIPATWHIYYELHITNTLGIAVTNVVLTDTKDARTYYIGTSVPYFQRSGENTFVWHLGSLAAGAHRSVQFIVTTGPSAAGQTMHNQASVSCDQGAVQSVTHDTRIGPRPVTPTHTPTQTPTRTRTATPTATRTVTPTPTTSATPAGGVVLRLLPWFQEVRCGQLFEVQVVCEAGTQPVAAADVFLDLDPTRVQVESIAEGSGLSLLASTFDNALGQVAIGAGTLGSPVQGTFVLATLHLRARACSANEATHITFSLAGVRQTVVRDEAQHNVLGALNDALVNLELETPTPTATETATVTATPTMTPTPMRHWLYIPCVPAG